MNCASPIVSAIVAACNAADTIARTLDSLCNQDFPFWETVLVDDGSTDGTPDIAAAYAARDSRIHVVRQANAGLGAARNTGLAHARGSHIHCIDADDVIEPTFYSEMLAAIAADRAAAPAAATPGRCAVSGYVQFLDNGEERLRIHAPKTEAFTPEILCRHNFGPPLNFLFERRILDVCGHFDATLPHCQDWDLWLRFARAGVRFLPLRDRILARYRLRPASLSRNHVRFLRTVFEVVGRAGRPDPRLPLNAGRDRTVPRDMVDRGRAQQWAYCLKKAATARDGDALDTVWTIAREILPHQMFRCPEAYGVDLNFMPVEASTVAQADAESAMRALYETAKEHHLAQALHAQPPSAPDTGHEEVRP